MASDNVKSSDQDPVDWESLQLKPLQVEAKLSVSDKLKVLSEVSLLAVSTQYGFAILGTTKGFAYTTLSGVRQTLTSSKKGTVVPLANVVHVPLDEVVVNVKLSADELSILICTASGKLHVYDPRHVAQNKTQSSKTISLRNVLNILPNPRELPHLVAVLCSDGQGQIVDIKGSAKPGELSAYRITSMCWSKKGKQLACGLQDGTIVQVTPEGSEKKRIGVPPNLDFSASVSSILWIDTTTFVLAYSPSNPDDSSISPLYTITHEGPSKNLTYTQLGDPFFPEPDRKSFYYNECISPLSEQIRHLIICGNAHTTDLAFLGCDDTGKWANWMLEDGMGVSMPLDENEQNTFVVGMAIDFTSQESLLPPTPDEPPINPVPILLVYTSQGHLLAYHCVDAQAVKTKYVCPLMKAAQPLPGGATPLPAPQSIPSAPAPVQKSAPPKAAAPFTAPAASFAAPVAPIAARPAPFAASTPTFGTSTSAAPKPSVATPPPPRSLPTASVSPVPSLQGVLQSKQPGMSALPPSTATISTAEPRNDDTPEIIQSKFGELYISFSAEMDRFKARVDGSAEVVAKAKTRERTFDESDPDSWTMVDLPSLVEKTEQLANKAQHYQAQLTDLNHRTQGFLDSLPQMDSLLEDCSRRISKLGKTDSDDSTQDVPLGPEDGEMRLSILNRARVVEMSLNSISEHLRRLQLTAVETEQRKSLKQADWTSICSVANTVTRGTETHLRVLSSLMEQLQPLQPKPVTSFLTPGQSTSSTTSRTKRSGFGLDDGDEDDEGCTEQNSGPSNTSASLSNVRRWLKSAALASKGDLKINKAAQGRDDMQFKDPEAFAKARQAMILPPGKPATPSKSKWAPPSSAQEAVSVINKEFNLSTEPAPVSPAVPKLGESRATDPASSAVPVVAAEPPKPKPFSFSSPGFGAGQSMFGATANPAVPAANRAGPPFSAAPSTVEEKPKQASFVMSTPFSGFAGFTPPSKPIGASSAFGVPGTVESSAKPTARKLSFSSTPGATTRAQRSSSVASSESGWEHVKKDEDDVIVGSVGSESPEQGTAQSTQNAPECVSELSESEDETDAGDGSFIKTDIREEDTGRPQGSDEGLSGRESDGEEREEGEFSPEPAAPSSQFNESRNEEIEEIEYSAEPATSLSQADESGREPAPPYTLEDNNEENGSEPSTPEVQAASVSEDHSETSNAKEEPVETTASDGIADHTTDEASVHGQQPPTPSDDENAFPGAPVKSPVSPPTPPTPTEPAVANDPVEKPVTQAQEAASEQRIEEQVDSRESNSVPAEGVTSDVPKDGANSPPTEGTSTDQGGNAEEVLKSDQEDIAPPEEQADTMDADTGDNTGTMDLSNTFGSAFGSLGGPGASAFAASPFGQVSSSASPFGNPSTPTPAPASALSFSTPAAPPSFGTPVSRPFTGAGAPAGAGGPTPGFGQSPFGVAAPATPFGSRVSSMASAVGVSFGSSLTPGGPSSFGNSAFGSAAASGPTAIAFGSPIAAMSANLGSLSSTAESIKQAGSSGGGFGSYASKSTGFAGFASGGTPTGFGGFGSAQPAQPSGFGAFGSQQAPQPAAQAFGAQPTAFGSSGFGQPASQQAPAFGGFGASQPQQPSSGFGGFGGSAFGGATQQPQAGTVFGGAPAMSPFGQVAATNPQSSIFGQAPAPNTGGMFGSTSSKPDFSKFGGHRG
ncbi:uncharacterized protein EV422DRAFT_567535 [Fimicolochytrium jonesii]|uniref:uncharacterized protein n=1 Tax=Fimicolochytrium jonesii TaxID=1396493 RepID=UPI0022FDD671|nr:uncharacterized protein EV422DRAFT_567535 [Fimicolochytrium jonesii]KAI8820640.1 hypothetical protein EV422DRAFT_567535 [Fimicolochytrium jonesii]